MAEAEVLGEYKSIKVVPAGAKLLGEVDTYNNTIGFHLTAFTAVMLADSESSTFIIAAERVKVTKVAGEAWTAGDPVYWDEANSRFTITAASLTKAVGKVSQAALTAAVIGYIVFMDKSPIQRGLAIGTAAVPLAVIADDPMLKVYCTSAITTGAIRAAEIGLTMTAASNGNQVEALKVTISADVKTGAWANVIFAQLDYVTDGLAHGAGSVICAEISLPASSVVRGTYYVWQSEIDCPTGCIMNANPIAVMSISVWGGAKAQFDTVGLLFDISGVTSGSGKFFYDNTANAADAFLKCRINGATYYLPLSDDTSWA